MILQTGAGDLHGAASTQMKRNLHQFQNAMDGSRIGKRAEITGAVTLYAARHKYARILFLNGHLDIRIGLIVTQHDVVTGMMLFDERIFKNQRFRLIRDDNRFQVNGMAHHSRHLNGAV